MRLIIILIFCSMKSVSAQVGTWTWVSGDSTIFSNGNYGTQGIPSITNSPPARYEAAEWTDLNGDFWLYGGLGCDDGTNVCYRPGPPDTITPFPNSDLWKFNPPSNQWTWVNGSKIGNLDTPYHGVKGFPDTLNTPGTRVLACATWTGLDGSLWLFGGATMSTDTAAYMADLWKYNIQTNMWTWVAGPQTPSIGGQYGMRGIPDSSNYPGARTETSVSWIDSNGDLWLYGGSGYDGKNRLTRLGLNDLWKFDVSLSQWTWMHGDTTGILLGSFMFSHRPKYGVRGVFNPNNSPGGRLCYTHWKDANGKFWLFGGGFGGGNTYNDLWKYDPLINQWAWISGDTISPTACYGKKCITSPCNKPPARYEARANWQDDQGNFWFYGGGAGQFGDLWMYEPQRDLWTWVSGDSLSNWGRDPVYGIKGVGAIPNMPGPRGGAVSWKDTQGNLWLFGGNGKGNLSILRNDLWTFEIDTACIKDIEPIIANFTADTIQQCLPSLTVTFTNISQNIFVEECDSTKFIWDFGDGQIATDIATASDLTPDTIHTYTSVGIYEAKLIAIGACNGVDTFSIIIRVDTIPNAKFSASTANSPIATSGTNDSLTGCVPLVVAFTDSSFMASNYQWDFGDGNMNALINPVNIYVDSGKFYVVLTVSNLCGIDQDSLKIITNPLPWVNVGKDTTICPNVSMQLGVNTNSNYAYLWTPTQNLDDSTIGNPIATLTNSINFIVVVTNIITGCQNTDSIMITVNNSIPNVSVSSDITICKGESVQLIASGGIKYLWKPAKGLNNDTISSPISTVDSTTQYTVVFTTVCGIDSAFVSIKVEDCQLFIPNAFSPNGNKGNDMFRIRGEGIDEILIKIFDRWGNAVFETTDINQGWNGKNNKGSNMASGVYVYYLTVKFIDGKEIIRKGNITLLR